MTDFENRIIHFPARSRYLQIDQHQLHPPVVGENQPSSWHMLYLGGDVQPVLNLNHGNLTSLSNLSLISLFLTLLLLTGCESSKPIDPGDSYRPAETQPKPAMVPNETTKNTNSNSLQKTTTATIPFRIFKNQKVFETENKITSAEFRSLLDHPQLETLILDGGGIAPADLDHIHRLQNLTHLRIRNCKVGDQQILELTKLSKLRILNLPQAVFSDKALLILIEKLGALELLRFSSPHVTDVGISGLHNSASLRALHLIGVHVTDKSVNAISRIKPLETFYIDGGQITDQGFTQLIKMRPDLHLHVDQVHLDFDPNRHPHFNSKSQK